MIGYQCDVCHKWIARDPEITLKGYIGARGGILLPERLQALHFCSNKCFEVWIDKKELIKFRIAEKAKED